MVVFGFHNFSGFSMEGAKFRRNMVALAVGTLEVSAPVPSGPLSRQNLNGGAVMMAELYQHKYAVIVAGIIGMTILLLGVVGIVSSLV